MEEIRKENTENGPISPGIWASFVGSPRLKDKLAGPRWKTRRKTRKHSKFIKTVTALARLLEKPELGEVLDGASRRSRRSALGNLLAFMHTFNLRFGPATKSATARGLHSAILPGAFDQTREPVPLRNQAGRNTAASAWHRQGL